MALATMALATMALAAVAAAAAREEQLVHGGMQVPAVCGGGIQHEQDARRTHAGTQHASARMTTRGKARASAMAGKGCALLGP